MTYRVLVVDDMVAISGFLKTVLQGHGFEVEVASDGEEALGVLRSAPFDVLISDIAMEPMNGIDLLSVVVQEFPDVMTIMLTGFGELKSAATAMTLGAFDYLEKPISVDAVLTTVKCAIAYGQARNGGLDLALIGAGHRSLRSIVAQSERMEHACSILSHVLKTDSNIYIFGEKGVGRERVVRALHDSSNRAGRPFLRIDCSVLEAPGSGSEAGLGGDGEDLLATISGGTLVLDRIDETPYAVQKGLDAEIRALQDNSESEPDPDNPPPRVIGIAQRSVDDRAQDGRFYLPLFKRVAQVTVRIPSLRERRADLIPLMFHVAEERLGPGEPMPFVELEICDAFEVYDWPGNVEELESTMHYALDRVSDGRLCMEHLPEAFVEWAAQNVNQEDHDLDSMFERKSSLLAFLRKKSRESVARIDQMYPGSV